MKSDYEIQQDVMDELSFTPLLNATEIGVAVKNGVVTLSGTVDSYSKKTTAENAAKNVAGVKAVAEDINVKISSSGQRTDAEIAEAIINAFKWHSSVPDDSIKVKVENGWVTLEGEVDWEYQRSAARNFVENLSGVAGVFNNIKLKSVVATSDIKRKISAAFHRSATVDSERINLDVSGSKVILRGKVRSFAEKKDAESAAWLAPGVNQVENEIEVDTQILAY